MVTIPQDFFIIELERVWDVQKRKSGIITLNDAPIENRAKDDDTDRNRFKRIYGTAISIPLGYSDMKLNPIDQGAPAHRIYVGHDLIQERINEGYTDWSNKKYHPGSLDSWPFITLADVGERVDVKVGERVVINPMAIEPEHLIGTVDGKPHFKVRVDDILGAGTPLRAQGGWAWVQPDKETWEEITSRGGIITKAAPGYKNLRGTVIAGPAKGEKVWFQTNSEWPFTLDGIEMYCMEQENILCVIEKPFEGSLKIGTIRASRQVRVLGKGERP